MAARLVGLGAGGRQASSVALARVGLGPAVRRQASSVAGAQPAQSHQVVVVGGGIGGLALARALVRKGIDAHVYEQAPSFSSTAGAGFIVQPNGAACLQALGVPLADIEHLVHPLKKLTLLGTEGKLLARSTAFEDIHGRYGQPLGGALRAELVDVLAQPLAAENRIHWASRVTAVALDDDGVTATLETGDEVRGDILIGADGVHSSIAYAIDAARERDLREMPRPGAHRFQPTLGTNSYTHERVFYGLIPDPDQPFRHDELGKPHVLLEDLSHGKAPRRPRGRGSAYPRRDRAHRRRAPSSAVAPLSAAGAGEFISYGLGRGTDASAHGGGPCRALMWMQTVRETGDYKAKDEWAAARDPTRAAEALRTFIARSPFHANHPIREAAERTARGRLSSFPISARAHRDVWHYGRVCLLGDAAHATLPYTAQGLNMSIEDAVVLADALAQAGNRPQAAFEAYTQKRHARTKACVAQAEANAVLLRSRAPLLDRWRDSLLGAVVSGGVLQHAFAAQIDGCPIPMTVDGKAA